MSRKRKNSQPFDSAGGVVTIQRRLLESQAYMGLSAQAKCIIHLMQRFWRPEVPVGYGIRQAMAEVPCSKAKAMTAMDELQEAGFIVVVDESLFCSRTQSKSRTWRLTWMPFNHYKPTNNWERTRDV